MDPGLRRLNYLDNLKVFLIILVILGHVSVTYGPVGFWYYYERTGGLSSYFLGFFTSFIQTFIIGLFLFVAAYFIPASYSRKGPGAYLLDRLKRLGIPLLAYIFFISPALMYVNEIIVAGSQIGFLNFYYHTIIRRGLFITGPLWFVQALLVFTVTYLVIKGTIENYTVADLKRIKVDLPKNHLVLAFVLMLALASFLVRVWFPIGSTTGNLQLSFVPQYLAMFIIGILASQNLWLDKLGCKKAFLWAGLALAGIPFWPLIIGYGEGFKDMAPIAGGLSWHSLAYSLWEAVVGLGTAVGLTYFFRQRLNFKGSMLKHMANGAYAAFIIHPLVLLPLSYLLREVMLDPLIKFTIVGTLGVPLCFIAGILLKKIPAIKNIL